MEDAALPVIIGLAVGISFIVIFAVAVANMAPMEQVTDDGFYPYITVVMDDENDPDGCCDNVSTVTFQSELNLAIDQNGE